MAKMFKIVEMIKIGMDRIEAFRYIIPNSPFDWIFMTNIAIPRHATPYLENARKIR